MAENPVGWFEIYVNEIDISRLFYESVLRVQLEKPVALIDPAIEMLVFPSN